MSVIGSPIKMLPVELIFYLMYKLPAVDLLHFMSTSKRYYQYRHFFEANIRTGRIDKMVNSLNLFEKGLVYNKRPSPLVSGLNFDLDVYIYEILTSLYVSAEHTEYNGLAVNDDNYDIIANMISDQAETLRRRFDISPLDDNIIHLFTTDKNGDFRKLSVTSGSIGLAYADILESGKILADSCERQIERYKFWGFSGEDKVILELILND